MLKQHGVDNAPGSTCKSGEINRPQHSKKQTAGPGHSISYHVVLNLLKVFMAYFETCQQTLKNLLTEIKRLPKSSR